MQQSTSNARKNYLYSQSYYESISRHCFATFQATMRYPPRGADSTRIIIQLRKSVYNIQKCST